MTRMIDIAGRLIGPGHPPYIVAELSGNHNGDISRAMRLIEVAKKAGADAVKLQTYTADTITIDHDGPGFVIEGGLWNGRKLYDLYREAHTPWEWHERLFACAADLGIACFSSPFDATAVDLLEGLGAPAYKIASFEVIDIPLIRYAANTGKPMIISTGMAGVSEIAEAVANAEEAGANGVAVLHCVSGYPTPPSEANLARIVKLAATHDCVTGLSDHSLGIAVAVASVALGAAVIEKHVTLARADGGPDAAFSLEPDELKRMIGECRDAWLAIGHAEYEPGVAERGSMPFRRSLYVVEDVPAGAELTARNIRSIRPGYGLSPKYLPQVVGLRAVRALKRGSPLSWDDVSSGPADFRAAEAVARQSANSRQP